MKTKMARFLLFNGKILIVWDVQNINKIRQLATKKNVTYIEIMYQ